MRIITNIRGLVIDIKNLIAFYKWEKNVVLYIDKIEGIDNYTKHPDYLVKFTQRLYKKKNSNYRNLTASIARQYRKICPFQPEDFSAAKDMYDEYFTLPNHIKSKEDLETLVKTETVYLYQFRIDFPVKGEDIWGSYYINGSYGEGRIIMCEDIDDLDGVYITCCLYATIDQIKEFHSKRIKRLQDQVDALQDQISTKQLEINYIKELL